MSGARAFLVAAAVALGGVSPSRAVAQSVAAPVHEAMAFAPAPTPVKPAVLKPSYHLRLTSTWPQENAANGCRNGGREVVEGTLLRDADGTYIGTFRRRTELLFCGEHGTAAGSCALVLNGQGKVAMTGRVTSDAASPDLPSVRVMWTPVGAHEVTVTGACPASFKDAVKAMYLTTPHAAEFSLTGEGTGPRTERLENYAWIVEVD